MRQRWVAPVGGPSTIISGRLIGTVRVFAREMLSGCLIILTAGYKKSVYPAVQEVRRVFVFSRENGGANGLVHPGPPNLRAQV
ncbi:hypothetical protein ACFX1W_007408 [Malus domestica]